MLSSNFKTLKTKQYQNTNNTSSKIYDLESRTFEFAVGCRNYIKSLPKTISNTEYGKQLIRSSGSVAANYIEANESLSKKDFGMRIKISRKEAKESKLWLSLIEPSIENIKRKGELIQEATELTKIFGSIVEKSK
jgi:four helix bundle protein